MTATLRSVSLCTGYGGLDMATEAVLGAVTVAHAEIDSAAARLLEHRYPGIPNLGDIKTIDWTVWADVIELITAGYPCQPFSGAGRRKGTDDPRHLWPFVLRAIRGVRPRLVVLENVAGHRSLGFDTVLADLAAIGYDARWTSLRASDIGAPHRRERLWIVAHPRSETVGLRPGLRESGPGRIGGRRPDDDAAQTPTDTSGDGLGQLQAPHDDDRADALRNLALGRAAADASSQGREGHGSAIADGRPIAADGSPADTARDGWDEGWAESARLIGGSDAAERGPGDATNWGSYEPAIRRWEVIVGRVAPPPTEANTKGGQRLSPAFVEWMMGLPAGHVTDVPGISRNDQLKILGNGVVPQQAVAALEQLLADDWTVAA